MAESTATGVDPRDLKRRETWLRRVAERQGLRLRKSKRKDRRALDYRRVLAASDPSGRVVHPRGRDAGRGVSLDDVEEVLTGVRPG